MALFGPPNVKKMRECKDVEGLIKALGYQKESGVRKAAAEVLGEIIEDYCRGIGRPRGIIYGYNRQEIENDLLALIEALMDNDKSVREAVIKSLGCIEDECAIEALIKVINDDDIDIRKAAIEALTEALGRFCCSQVVESSINAIKDNTSTRTRQMIIKIWKQERINTLDKQREEGLKDPHSMWGIVD